MNNQRNNSNRRRGRGNRNQGSGGGNQGNRIDSRARGNAPQMLEKYKKLAQDAQHNGDRVQAEYYLQFADHYFRVLADNRTRQDGRQDEGRPNPRQREERDFDDGNEDGDFDDRQRPAAAASSRRPRDRDDNRDDQGRDDRGREQSRGREDTRYESRDDSRRRPRDRDEAPRESDADTRYEPAENPFLRTDAEEARPPSRGGLKPRRAEAKAAAPKGEIDAAVLPPSIGARETANDGADDRGDEDRPAPRPKATRRRKPKDDGAVSAVG